MQRSGLTTIGIIVFCAPFLLACATQTTALRKVTGGLYAGYMPFGDKKPNAQPEYHAFAQQLHTQIETTQSKASTLMDESAGTITQARQTLQQFQSIKATLQARLQMGSTPNNPALQNLLHDAQAQLTQMEVLIARLARLQGQAQDHNKTLTDVSDAAQSALELPGAMDDDSAALRQLRAQALIAAVPLNLLLKDLQDYGRKLAPNIAQERTQIGQLAQAVRMGQWVTQANATSPTPQIGAMASKRIMANSSPHDRAGHAMTGYSSATSPTLPTSDNVYLPPHTRPTGYDIMPPEAHSSSVSRNQVQPLPLAAKATTPSSPAFVVIRFRDAQVDYDASLARAVAAVKERCPTSAFTIAASIPHHNLDVQTRTQADSYARRVARSLQALDIPPQNIALAPSQLSNVTTSEVRIYLR